MRIKKIAPALLIIALLCCSLKCRKDKDKPPVTLPPITQEGKNTFGCKVDGEIWVPHFECGGFGSNPCGELIVDIRKLSQGQLPVEINFRPGIKYPDNSISAFNISSNNSSGIYTAGDKADSVQIRYKKPNSLLEYYNTGSTNKNKFQITKLDTINKIISGTFEAILYKTFTDSVKITEGRFDLRFQACQCSN